jgi:hypothetical protein
VSDPEKRKIAIALAKCHLDTVMSDYVIFGFDRYKDPIDLQEEINVLTVEALQKLCELTLTRMEQLANGQ